MRSLLMVFMLTVPIAAQQFVVEKVSGEVKALKGTSEEWFDVSKGAGLESSDMIVTGDDSFIQLNKSGSRFLLNESSALGLDYIREISINDLLLALAMEDIRETTGDEDESRNTAVYGTNTDEGGKLAVPESELGIKKLNGAVQLAENGYKEAALLLAKETYRKYPETKSSISKRLYFVDLFIELELIDEAGDELHEIRRRELSQEQLSAVKKREEALKDKLVVE